MKSRKLSILVYSCWKNRDMWEIFLSLFHKYWPDCQYSIILLTDKIEGSPEKYSFDKILALDSSWYDMISNGIRNAGTPYVMLFMDDYLFSSKMENSYIEKYIESMKKYDSANIRFTKSVFTKTEKFDLDSDFRKIVPGSAYSLSTQIGIWNGEILLSYMKPEWTAWDFERIGSLEVKDYSHPILETVDFRMPYEEGVRKGKWMPQGIKVCRENGIEIDFGKRPEMGFKDNFIRNAKTFILKLSPNLVQKLQNHFSR